MEQYILRLPVKYCAESWCVSSNNRVSLYFLGKGKNLLAKFSCQNFYLHLWHVSKIWKWICIFFREIICSRSIIEFYSFWGWNVKVINIFMQVICAQLRGKICFNYCNFFYNVQQVFVNFLVVASFFNNCLNGVKQLQFFCWADFWAVVVQSVKLF